MKLIGRVVRQYRTFRPVIATKNVLYGLTEREKRKSFGPANADDTNPMLYQQ